jgi:hypothetical protein
MKHAKSAIALCPPWNNTSRRPSVSGPPLREAWIIGGPIVRITTQRLPESRGQPPREKGGQHESVSRCLIGPGVQVAGLGHRLYGLQIYLVTAWLSAAHSVDSQGRFLARTGAARRREISRWLVEGQSFGQRFALCQVTCSTPPPLACMLFEQALGESQWSCQLVSKRAKVRRSSREQSHRLPGETTFLSPAKRRNLRLLRETFTVYQLHRGWGNATGLLRDREARGAWPILRNCSQDCVATVWMTICCPARSPAKRRRRENWLPHFSLTLRLNGSKGF